MPDREWTFRSTTTDPSGVRVTTVITVPVEVAQLASNSVHECGELAQMGANQTATRVLKAMAEECPF